MTVVVSDYADRHANKRNSVDDARSVQRFHLRSRYFYGRRRSPQDRLKNWLVIRITSWNSLMPELGSPGMSSRACGSSSTVRNSAGGPATSRALRTGEGDFGGPGRSVTQQTGRLHCHEPSMNRKSCQVLVDRVVHNV